MPSGRHLIDFEKCLIIERNQSTSVCNNLKIAKNFKNSQNSGNGLKTLLYALVIDNQVKVENVPQQAFQIR